MGFQNRHVDLRNYALLMEHRRNGNYRVLEWISSFGSGVLMPNLNHRDPGLQTLMGDRRFRTALSHAIHRREISEAIFSGMGEPMQLAPTPGTPLFREEYARAFTEYDPATANGLLDEMGLTRRDRYGMRLRPDGTPLRLTIDMFDLIADVSTMQLVADAWTAVGVKTDVKQLARSLFYTRMPARLHDVAVGGNSSMHTPMLDHMYFVPIGLGSRHALGYAAWFMSGGERGEEPPPEMKQVVDLYRQIENTADREKQEALAHQILEINSRNLWLIGLVGDLPGLTLIHDSFRNVPDRAVIFGNAGVTAPECYAIERN
jgi:peptide/nickel transport system substrate-binding protein